LFSQKKKRLAKGGSRAPQDPTSCTPLIIVILQTVTFGIRLARLKFELTDQDSAGTENLTVLTSMFVNRKGIEIGQLFSLEMVLDTHGKGFSIANTMSDCKKWEI